MIQAISTCKGPIGRATLISSRTRMRSLDPPKAACAPGAALARSQFLAYADTRAAYFAGPTARPVTSAADERRNVTGIPTNAWSSVSQPDAPACPQDLTLSELREARCEVHLRVSPTSTRDESAHWLRVTWCGFLTRVRRMDPTAKRERGIGLWV